MGYNYNYEKGNFHTGHYVYIPGASTSDSGSTSIVAPSNTVEGDKPAKNQAQDLDYMILESKELNKEFTRLLQAIADNDTDNAKIIIGKLNSLVAGIGQKVDANSATLAKVAKISDLNGTNLKITQVDGKVAEVRVAVDDCYTQLATIIDDISAVNADLDKQRVAINVVASSVGGLKATLDTLSYNYDMLSAKLVEMRQLFDTKFAALSEQLSDVEASLTDTVRDEHEQTRSELSKSNNETKDRLAKYFDFTMASASISIAVFSILSYLNGKSRKEKKVARATQKTKVVVVKE